MFFIAPYRLLTPLPCLGPYQCPKSVKIPRDPCTRHSSVISPSSSTAFMISLHFHRVHWFPLSSDNSYWPRFEIKITTYSVFRRIDGPDFVVEKSENYCTHLSTHPDLRSKEIVVIQFSSTSRITNLPEQRTVYSWSHSFPIVQFSPLTYFPGSTVRQIPYFPSFSIFQVLGLPTILFIVSRFISRDRYRSEDRNVITVAKFENRWIVN